MRKIEAILFDMDGVLVDSEIPLMKCCIKHLKEKYGIEAKLEDFNDFVGMGEDAAIGGVVEKNGGTYLPQMKDECYEIYIQLAGTIVDAAPNMSTVLPELKKKYRLAVASSADRRKVVTNINVLGVEESVFDSVITGSDITNKKPDPEIYLKAAASVGVAPENCMVVEDAVAGVLSGKAAGCYVVGVKGSFSKEELIGAGADAFVDSTCDIVDILAAF